jgi:hypothetical protein
LPARREPSSGSTGATAISPRARPASILPTSWSCCYPDPDLLVGAAARHARRLLALSFPRDTWWLRIGFRLVNVWCRLTGGIEAFVHPPAQVLRAAEAQGLRLAVHERASRVWRVAVFERV